MLIALAIVVIIGFAAVALLSTARRRATTGQLSRETQRADASTPAALAQMIDDRRSAAAIGEAEATPSHVLPANAWREILQRATTLGMVAELLAGGTEVRIVASAAADEG